MSVHLLILLVPVLSLCGATEYYVRPTETTNASCPAQPCLQYTNSADHYFGSNTVFKFLPGNHIMDGPLIIGNVHNMSLENLNDRYAHLVAQFPCETEVHDCIHVSETSTCGLEVHDFEVCCAAIWLHDVYNITVKGIHVAVSKNVSGVVLKNILWITVQLTTSCFLTNRKCLGIAIYGGTSVNVHSSSANTAHLDWCFVTQPTLTSRMQ